MVPWFPPACSTRRRCVSGPPAREGRSMNQRLIFQRPKPRSIVRKPIVFLFLLTALPFGSLLTQGIPAGHDAAAHCLWAQNIAHGWKQGRLYHRWVDDAADELGAPALVYYPPLASFVAAPLIVVDISPARAVAAALVLALILGAFGVRLLFSDLRQKNVASVLFLLCPYLAYDVFIRGAVAEVFGLALLPWLLFAIRKTLHTEGALRHALFLAAVSAALLLSHPLTALLFAPFALIWAIAETERPRNWLLLALGAVWAFALAAFYLWPWLQERDVVQYQALFEGGASLRAEQYLSLAAADSLGRRRSRVALALFGLLIGVLFLGFSSRRIGRGRAPTSDRSIALLGGGAAAYALMAMSLAEPLYELVPWLAAAQYPWRHLGPAWLLAILAAASLAARTRLAPLTRSLAIGIPAFAAAVVALSLGLKGHWSEIDAIPERWGDPTLAVEYTPKTAVGHSWPKTAKEPRTARVDRGRAEVLRRFPGLRDVMVAPIAIDSRAHLEVRTRSAPGWSVTVDGQPAELATGPWLAVDFQRPAGASVKCLFRYTGTESMERGAWISGGALLALLLALVVDQLISWRKVHEQ